MTLIANVFARARFEPNRVHDGVCSGGHHVGRLVPADVFAPGAVATFAANRRFNQRWIAVPIGPIPLE